MNRIVSLILPYYNRRQYLQVTLDSFEYFYKGRGDFQIVIVDDKSNQENSLDEIEFVRKYNLWIKVIRIENKRGINPCYPINVGVRNSKGDIVLLSSPEIFHTRNIFDVSHNFELLDNRNYLQFSVFCFTVKKINGILLDPLVLFSDKLLLMNGMNLAFHDSLGVKGYPAANESGTWYTHSKIAPGCYNFLSACTRETYYSLGGFNEAFVHGTGYDDTDFRDRMIRHVNNNVIWYDDFVAIHVDHLAVSSDNNTNLVLYNSLKNQTYEQNDAWGQL
jgi:glycosyltransferase involved in cell wall biosynthesis